jgi:hypothetical protein
VGVGGGVEGQLAQVIMLEWRSNLQLDGKLLRMPPPPPSPHTHPPPLSGPLPHPTSRSPAAGAAAAAAPRAAGPCAAAAARKLVGCCWKWAREAICRAGPPCMRWVG